MGSHKKNIDEEREKKEKENFLMQALRNGMERDERH